MCGWRRSILSLIAGDDVRQIEIAGFLGHAAVEDHLEQQIAELVLEIGHVVARDGVGDLIGFLDRVGRDRREGLDGIPFAAAVGIAQASHDRHQTLDARRLDRGDVGRGGALPIIHA